MTDENTDWREKALKWKKQLAWRATHDSLTGLPNRMLFIDRLSMAIIHAQRERERAAVVILNLDGYKSVIHSLGLRAGDELIKEIAAELRRRLRKGDTLARMDMDEFLILLPRILRIPDAANTVAKVLESLKSESFLIQGQQLNITASAGIACYPEHGDQAEELIRCADIALCEAKQAGRDTQRIYKAM
ncbi:MAG: GGDEF domain-containing protein [Syntrophales bacterium]